MPCDLVSVLLIVGSGGLSFCHISSEDLLVEKELLRSLSLGVL